MTNEEGVTPRTPLGDQEKILTRAPLASGPKVTKETTPEKKQAPKLKTASKLLVSEAQFQEEVEIYAKLVLKGAEVKFVNSWQEMATFLQQYEKIDKLGLWFHGSPGNIKVNGIGKDLSQIKTIFVGNKPTVSEINLEACNVGKGASELIPFGQFFNTKKISAWNHYHVTQPITVIVQKNDDLSLLENKLARYKGYFFPGTPSASNLIKKPGTHKLIAEWFRIDFDFSELPPAPKPGDIDTRKKEYKPRSSAKKRHIRSNQVKKLQEEYDKAVLRPLEQIILEL